MSIAALPALDLKRAAGWRFGRSEAKPAARQTAALTCALPGAGDPRRSELRRRALRVKGLPQRGADLLRIRHLTAGGRVSRSAHSHLGHERFLDADDPAGVRA